MVRIGFILNISNAWVGGLNYYNNLFSALNQLNKNDFEIFIFVQKGIDKEIKNDLIHYGKVIEIDFIKKNNLKKIIWKLSEKIINSDFVVELFLWKYKIDIFCYSGLVKLLKAKTINWIPDFQHKHLPELFSKRDIHLRNKVFNKFAVYSDLIILSSFNAKKDFDIYFEKFSSKVRILQFSSNLGHTSSNIKDEFNDLKNKYNITSSYFIIPNQFWKHKNHMVVFRAMVYLKEKGINLNLICTGLLKDYRDTGYSNEVINYIKKHQLNVNLLGVINYKDLVLLLKNSIAVINPSLFEGWSTIVEECKSLGKNMILSDIEIHREQNPPFGVFFNPKDSIELANILKYHNENEVDVMKLYNSTELTYYLNKRTYEFGEKIMIIFKELVNCN
jgi:glycosyltransferase involved in cell wall biosynthesis